MIISMSHTNRYTCMHTHTHRHARMHAHTDRSCSPQLINFIFIYLQFTLHLYVTSSSYTVIRAPYLGLVGPVYVPNHTKLQVLSVIIVLPIPQADFCQTWPRGYKTFFLLSSAEIYPAHKC